MHSDSFKSSTDTDEGGSLFAVFFLQSNEDIKNLVLKSATRRCVM